MEELQADKIDSEKSETKLRHLFDLIPYGIVVIDMESGLPLEFNARMHEQLGYSSDEFRTMKIVDYEAVENLEEHQKHMTQIISEGHDIFETKHRRKDGKLIDIEVSVVHFFAGKKAYLMGVCSDISEKKVAERLESERQKAFEEQAAFLRTLVDTIPDLVWMKDVDGKYLACNPMFERLYDAKESEILGKSDFDFVDSELAQFFRDHDKRAMESGGSRSNEEYLTFADGSYEGLFDTIKTPMKGQDGSVIGVLGIARDISERKESEKEVQKIQELSHIGTWTWDILRDEFSASDEAYRIFSLPIGSRISFESVLECIHPEDREQHQIEVMRLLGGESFDLEYRLLNQAGEIKWIEATANIFFDQKNHPFKAIGLTRDITERKLKEIELHQKDKALKAAQSISHTGSWKLETAKNRLEWSDECYRIFGIEIGTVVTYEMFLNTIHPDDREKVNYAWNEALRGAAYVIEHRIIVNDKVEWVKEKAELEFDTVGNLIAGVGTVQLISERKAYEEQLEKMANYDLLTGLANRSLLLSYLQSEVDKGLRENLTTALILLDLDRFKDVNDSFGHQAGDALLIKVAERLKSRMREGDLIARLGGDEFALILDNLVRIEDAGRITEEILNTLGQEYFLEGGVSIHVGASAGIVLAPNQGNNALELLQYADAALYRAKNEGRGIYHYYSDDLTDAARRRIDCETQLRRAIENEEFEVYYQPQVHMATGRIVGAEALIRWNDPVRGLISPALFIPLAEETGLIGKIGEWVLNETCRQGKVWLDKGYRLTLAVNLSAHQMRHQDVPKMVDQALKRSGYSADRLELELTESALMDREEEVVATLHTLRARGVRLAIDDFGTGYSSLSYLKRFPIDVLKIDKSFVDDIPFEADDMAIVSAIIAMGKALGFQVLAEGTERQEQLDFLQERGCTLYQGYIKSPPLPAAEFEKLLFG